MRTIKVQGCGVATAVPDTAVISFACKCKGREYAKCLNDLNNRTAVLFAEIESAGIPRAELCTSHFTIRVETQENSGRNVFMGYECSHHLHISFAAEKEFLNQILRQLVQGNSGAEINIQFTIKDCEPLREEALRIAVKQAQTDAAILADAAGLKLGSIEYLEHDIEPDTLPQKFSFELNQTLALGESHVPNLEPEPIELKRSVKLTYGIVS